MPELSILGVTHLSDFYPNVKYKLRLISELTTVNTRLCLYDLGAGGLYSSLKQGGWYRTMLAALRLGFGTLWVFLRFLCHRTERVYVAYPAPALTVLLGLLPQRWRPVIYLDAFISLYDTVVHDRAMLSTGSWQATLLFRFERLAFTIADHVLVDTPDNARYYSRLFDLPPSRFHAVPLCIPPLRDSNTTLTSELPTGNTRKFTCLFIGSLVPLHGIDTILAAAKQLAQHSNLGFVIVGDGQEAWRIEKFLQENVAINLQWHRGMHSTAFLIEAIKQADLCLGIFGSSGKAQRVLPYKIYYYAALAKPFLTLRTACLQHYCQSDEKYFLSEPGGTALAHMIERYLSEPALRIEAAAAADRLYQQQMSPGVIAEALARLFALGKADR